MNFLKHNVICDMKMIGLEKIQPLQVRAKIKQQLSLALLLMIIAATAALIPEPEAAKIQRRWWVRPWLQDKTNKAGLKMLKEEFQQDPSQFKQFLRMSDEVFNKLLNWVKPLIEKKDTNYREAISAKTKLIITLRFLATGETYRSLMYMFRVHESTISIFVPQVCEAIYTVLKEKYVKVITNIIYFLFANFLYLPFSISDTKNAR